MKYFTPRYDPEWEEMLARPGREAQARLRAMPKWRQELASHRAASTLRKNIKKRQPEVDRVREAREEVEQQAAATLRRCIEALEMALDAVNATPAPVKYRSSINVRALINAVLFMRDKCGLRD